MLYSRSKNYMFRPVVAIIRSLSFDSLKIVLYNCVAASLMWRSQHQRPLFEYDISILGVWVNHLMTEGISRSRNPNTLSQ